MVDFSSQISIMTESMLNLETLWRFNRFQPNEQQRAAIENIDGPLYITAGPGSGKTRVLLWRTVNLIVFHDVKPEEIFLSTFTEKAAHQLKEGLRGLLGYATSINAQPYDLSKMYIGTVHSLCRRILNDRRKFLQDYHSNPTPSLMDELGQYFHVTKRQNWEKLGSILSLSDTDEQNQVINSIFGNRKQSKHSAASSCISFFNRCGEECIEPAQAIQILQNPNEELLQYFSDQGLVPEDLLSLFSIYEQYLDSLKRNDKLRYSDFSHLQQDAYKVLLSMNESQNHFKHVIIDEYQDTNTIQEKIFFQLAKEHKNICVVGDDDQALYRFRGATVENFVDFPERCKKYLQVSPRRISLSTNYRSRKRIVEFYTEFMEHQNWKKTANPNEFYRVMDKNITAANPDDHLSILASTADNPQNVCKEIAGLTRKLLDQGKVEDPNQIAFLFPSLKSDRVKDYKDALEEVGLQVYAPRAGRFIEVSESRDIFGLIALILGLPEIQGGWGGEYGDFCRWMNEIELNGKALTREDPYLKQFVKDKRDEVARACSDFEILQGVARTQNWDMNESFDTARMRRKLSSASGLSDVGKKLLTSRYLEHTIEQRIQQGRPFSLSYIIKRVTSLDWSILDLFYRLVGFSHFKEMFDLAENGRDEGPICNLSLITQYLSRFVDDFIPVLTADLLKDGMFHRVFYFSFLFSLFRLGESEYEDAEDPFPKGRIPFLTIHQSKGLEFPVVVLANPRRNLRDADFIEKSLFPFTENEKGEPLDRQSEFDTMRMFYVALSRAQNLAIIAHYKSSGNWINQPFRTLLDDHFPRIPQFDLSTMPEYQSHENELPKMYSFTSDYLLYKKCPRQYMIFRKYGFVPSRSQTMFFGSLVHQTLEDLHHEIIRRRSEVSNDD